MVFVAVGFKRGEKGTDIYKRIVFVFKKRFEKRFPDMDNVKVFFQFRKVCNGNEMERICLRGNEALSGATLPPFVKI